MSPKHKRGLFPTATCFHAHQAVYSKVVVQKAQKSGGGLEMPYVGGGGRFSGGLELLCDFVWQNH